MEPKFQKSFIPKKPVVNGIQKEHRFKSRSRPNLLTIIGGILFILVLLAAGGIFMYGKVLEKSIETKQQELEDMYAALNLEELDEIIALDKKIRAAENLLSQHAAVTPVFQLLEESTLTRARFNSFIFDETAERARAQLSGEALGYNEVARQYEIFLSNPDILDVEISGLSLDEATGRVTFSVGLVLDKTFVDFKNTLRSFGEVSFSGVIE